MNGVFNIFLAFVAVLTLVVFSGCSGDSEPFSIDRSIKGAFGSDDRTPVENAKELFDIKDPDLRRQAIASFMKHDWALQEPYLQRYAQLTDPKIEPVASVRSVAVQALGRAQDRNYENQIVACLKDPSADVRWDTARVLNDMPIEKAVGELQLLAVNDASENVRAASAAALRHYRTDDVFRTLLRCLDDSDLNVRLSAHDSLVNQTGMDLGMDSRNWSKGKAGQETLPEPEVIHKKRSWWDWFGLFDH